MLRQGVNFNEGADGYFQKAGVKAWGEQGCRGRGLSWKRENSMRRKDREIKDFDEIVTLQEYALCRYDISSDVKAKVYKRREEVHKRYGLQ